MAANLLWLNGTDADDLGFYLVDAPDLLGEGARTPQTVGFPQGTGALLASTPVAVAPRSLRLSGFCTAATVSAARVIADRIKAHVGTGVVEIRSAWNTSVVVRGVLTNVAAGPDGSSWLGRVSLDLDFLLFDPYAYAISPTVVGFGATPTAIALGTAPSVGRDTWSAIITIVGAATTPTLTEYDGAGTALRTMVWTTSPTVTDAIEVDLGRGLVTNIASGVRTNGYSSLTAGFEFPRLDPADGDWYLGGIHSDAAFPRLAVSSGAALVRYFKAYR